RELFLIKFLPPGLIPSIAPSISFCYILLVIAFAFCSISYLLFLISFVLPSLLLFYVFSSFFFLMVLLFCFFLFFLFFFFSCVFLFFTISLLSSICSWASSGAGYQPVTLFPFSNCSCHNTMSSFLLTSPITL